MSFVSTLIYNKGDKNKNKMSVVSHLLLRRTKFWDVSEPTWECILFGGGLVS